MTHFHAVIQDKPYSSEKILLSCLFTFLFISSEGRVLFFPPGTCVCIPHCENVFDRVLVMQTF